MAVLRHILPCLLVAPLVTATSAACTSLSSALGQKVVYPLSIQYTSSLTSYWSSQESSLTPNCIVQPTSSQDVSVALTTLYNLYGTNSSNALFAVRGGGHSPTAGWANIGNGVTLDLSTLKNISVSADQTVTHVGAGAAWVDVYSYLDPMNLTITGGRAATVGVGGLTTGGECTHLLDTFLNCE
jgi:FAD/FMN-containing dehydrogenase